MRSDVVFTVVFRKDGEFLAAPTVLGEFGRELCVEIPNVIRAQVLAMAPNQEGSAFSHKVPTLGCWKDQDLAALEGDCRHRLQWVVLFVLVIELGPLYAADVALGLADQFPLGATLAASLMRSAALLCLICLPPGT